MLELKNIQIQYDQPVVYIEDMKLRSGLITTLFGESGSGKTSLLHVLAGKYRIGKGHYFLNNQEVEDISEFSRVHISIVQQTPIFLENMTLKKQLQMQLDLVGSSKNVEELFDKVNLDVNPNRFPANLSGGQKQKFAFALALAKETDIWLCDEITAALDQESKVMILDLLKELAVKENKMLILSSHDEIVRDYSDVIYEIKDQHIECVKEVDEKQSLTIQAKEIKSSFKIEKNLFTSYLMKHKFTELMRYVFISIALTFVAIGIHGAKQYTNHFKLFNSFNDVNNNYINYSNDKNSFYDQIDPEFPSELKEKVSQLAEVDGLEDYNALSRFNYYYDVICFIQNGNESFNRDAYDYGQINDETVFDYTIHDGNQDIQVEDTRKGKESFIYHGLIAPSYTQMNLDDKCVELVDQEGIYIAEDLFKQFGVNKLKKGMSITLTFNVPVARLKTSNSPYTKVLNKKVEKTFLIRGLVSNRLLSMASNAEYFLDPQQIEEIYQEVNASITLPESVTLSKESNLSDLEKQGYQEAFLKNLQESLSEEETATVTLTPYHTSMIYVYTKEGTNLNDFKTHLQDLDQKLELNNTVATFDQAKELYTSKEKLMNVYTGIVFVVIVVLSVLYSLMNKKDILQEQATLKQMGMSKKQIVHTGFTSIFLSWIILALTLSIFVFIGYKVAIYYGLIVKAMGYQQALNKSILIVLVLSVLVTLLMNRRRLHDYSN